MSTDTNIKTLIFNKLTQEQYNNADKVPTEFYLTPDTSIDSSKKGAANGVATLDSNTKVPVAQIPDLSSTYATINSLATVATSGSYNDLTNKPTIPTVNNATLTIQQNGSNITTFTANSSTNTTANITVPTKLSDLTNDSGFVKNGDVLLDVSAHSTANPRHIWQEKLDDCLYRAETRYTVNLTNFASGSNTAHLFDGNTDTCCSILAGNTGVVSISGNTNLGLGYPYGYIYCTFFYGCGPRDISDVTCRVYQNWKDHNIGWVTLTGQEVASSTLGGGIKSIDTLRFYTTKHGINQIEITLNNTNGTSTTEGTKMRLCAINFFATRTSIHSLPVLTKFGGDTIYGNVTIPVQLGSFKGNLTGTADKSVKDGDGNTISSTYVKVAQKGVANGVASLGSDGKVPQEQLPHISAATPVVDLGQVTSASFEVNKNYGASISGSASFTLPSPTDTTIANKITLNLNVLANSVINWGANVNAALAQFEPGKYQIRLLWNNTSSAWSAEVLKETTVDNGVSDLHDDTLATKAELAGYLPLSGGTLTGSLQLDSFIHFTEDRAGKSQIIFPGLGSISGFNTGNIFIQNANNGLIFRKSDNQLLRRRNNVDSIILTEAEKGVSGGVASLGSDGKVPQEQLPNISAATPVTALGQISTASLQTNNNYTASVSGSASFTLPTPTDTTIANKITVNLTVLSTANIDWGVNVNAALAEFTPGKYQIRLLWNNTSSAWSAEVLKETTVDNGVSDLHDIKIAELYSSISALQNELQILKGQSMKRLDYTNAVEFYLKEENHTSYTVPANGYIFGYGFQTYKTASTSYTGNILINGINVGKYFRKYTLKNDQVDTSIPLSMPLPVSAGDVITITGNREAFQEPYLFVAEKEG